MTTLARFLHQTRYFFALYLIFTLVVAVTACANLNPIAVAQTPEQRYAAVKLTYDAILTPAVKLIEDPSAPVDVRRSLQTAVAASGDVYKALTEAYVGYVTAKAQISAAPDGAAKVDVATANLENWLRQLESVTGRLAVLTKR